ncbi:MAG TPA: relaxase/mobilization nuclease domain-containing protein, partial [Puia sp.]|nr:relaxase/mobilization nuclease domain-containing protein [Puia sp.]
TYNEEKVAQGQAVLIHLNNFLQDKNNITYDDKLERFQRLNELNTRSRVNMLHATLNFHPSEKLSDEQLSSIADRYMQGMQMEDQPYLVYRHQDARHPHIHLVTSLIRPDGTRVNTHRMAIRLSEPTRKAIETEFQLLPARRPEASVPLDPNEVRKITPGDDTPLSQSVDRILTSVNRHYHFTNLNEYNAILRAYNVTAETGNPGSKTRRYDGIYYVALDDLGNKISPPMMASQLPSRPTLHRLHEKFHQPAANHLDHLASVRQRIDWALDQRPPTLRHLVSQLQGDGIEIVIPPGNGRNPHDQIFVDHRTRTAVTGATLGPGYTSAAINNSIDHGKKAGQRQHQTAQLPEGTHFNASVPQVLSAVLRTDPGGQRPDAIGQDQHLGPRRKL